MTWNSGKSKTSYIVTSPLRSNMKNEMMTSEQIPFQILIPFFQEFYVGNYQLTKK